VRLMTRVFDYGFHSLIGIGKCTELQQVSPSETACGTV